MSDAAAEDSRALWLDRAPRAAISVFVVVEVVALAVFVRAGRKQWFYLDEWDFLAARSAGDVGGLLRPHYEHWTTLPILVYRALWSSFGLNTYVPYLVVAIVVHLSVAALLLALMRRSGASVWIATALASVVALFGAGNENIIFGFQITFTGALAFGLLQMLLATSDPPTWRRDGLAVVAGLAAIMCSGPGLVLVGATGLAVLLRRGLVAALIQTLPLFAIYGLWSLVFGESSQFSNEGPPGLRTFVGFVARGFAGTFDAIGRSVVVGALLALLLVVGVGVAAATQGWDRLRRSAAGPLALAVGAVAFLVVTAAGRGSEYGSAHATEKRYLYMVAAMVAPLLAVAATALAVRWPRAAPIVLVVLLLGVPGNVAVAGDREPFMLGDEQFALTIPQLDQAQQAPDARPAGLLDQVVPVRWFLQGVREGRIPAPSSRSDAVDARARVAIALQARESPYEGGDCQRITAPVPVDLVVGQEIDVEQGSVRVADATTTPRVFASAYTAGFNGSLVVAASMPTVWSPYDLKRPPTVCGLGSQPR